MIRNIPKVMWHQKDNLVTNQNGDRKKESSKTKMILDISNPVLEKEKRNATEAETEQSSTNYKKREMMIKKD